VTHAATAEQANDFVMTDDAAIQERRSRRLLDETA
jgi:hypothetical protein